MYEVGAELFVRMGEFFVQSDDMFIGQVPMLPVGNDQIIWLRTNLPVMAGHCERLQLPITHDVIMGFYRDYEQQNPTWGEVQSRLSCMKQTFKAELNRRLCLFVHSHKSEYYSSPLEAIENALTADEIKTISSFPSIQEDFLDAGRCYAFERNTASVFHSMRVLEKGLHAFADELGLKRTIPIVLQDWQNIIEQINANIEGLKSLPKGIHKSELLKKYSDAALEFFYFKEAWRNHCMHSRETYDENQALRVLLHVRSFMHSLAQSGLREIRVTP